MTGNAAFNKQTPLVRHLPLSAGLLVAFAIRLFRLGAESLWYDETVSAYLARQSLQEMVEHTSLDIHPPGYYALLHGWVTLTDPWLGSTLEFLLAYPSVWFGILTVALLIPIGLRIVGYIPTILAVWIAALHPFMVWYSQEVRMYTVASALALLCLYAALRYLTEAFTDAERLRRRSYTWLVVYILSAAAGIFTLYYFAFALIAVNLAVVVSLIFRIRKGHTISSTLVKWLMAQIGVLLLFGPWVPLFIRQVLNPPVPPWRIPWSSSIEFFSDIAQAFAALVVGQSIPSGQAWLWLFFSILLLVAYAGYAKSKMSDDPLMAWIWLPVYALIPLVLLFGISLSVVPIYHVRYLAIYAPVFALITAAALVFLYTRSRPLFLLATLVLLIGSVYSLARYWQSPLYRADDHRSAVAMIADQWRPGDAIIANAGWIYTAIDTYWPVTTTNGQAAIPGSSITWHRLTDASVGAAGDSSTVAVDLGSGPHGYITGSVDGEASLGWGSPDADFFAMSRYAAVDSLDGLAADALRIWHYRLYDTVNDSDGVIRTWLDDHAELQVDVPFSGNGFLRLQRYGGTGDSAPSSTDDWTSLTLVDNGISIDILTPNQAVAGEYLYLPTVWTLPSETDADASSGLSTSIRLVDVDGEQWAQHDEQLPPIGAAKDFQFTAALPIHASTPPGEYSVQLVVYQTDDLQPLIIASSDSEGSQVAEIGAIEIVLADEPPTWTVPLAGFDYIDLIEADIPAGEQAPGSSFDVELVWRPRESQYRDGFNARILLVAEDGTIATEWDEPMGGSSYPSSLWKTDYPVRDQQRLMIPEGVVPGAYELRLSVVRGSDGKLIPVRSNRLLPFTMDSYYLGTLMITE